MGYRQSTLEGLVVRNLFGGLYQNKTVLITGHTGFKGSWLAYWLSQMGAKVVGYSLKPPTTPNHFELLGLDIVSIIGDLRDKNKLDQSFETHKPDIVFHLAAQPLVRLSYEEPVETYETNVLGTLNVFEACRKTKVKAIVNITSDKAYENKEWVWGYREDEPLGGYDPYSSSKACADILATSYRNSYFNIKDYKKTHSTLLATCRAGNVIGGGDWAKDRLITDIMLSVAEGETVSLRNPKATRPWQHVLEPLSGYLQIGQKLLEGKIEFADAWNFGPNQEGSITVEQVVKTIKKYWEEIDYEIIQDAGQLHEANLLNLDCSKAKHFLNWQAVWDSEQTFEKTVNWYKSYYENNKLLTRDNLESYIKAAINKELEWTS